MKVNLKKETKTVKIETAVAELTKDELIEVMAETTATVVNDILDDDGKGIPESRLAEALKLTAFAAMLASEVADAIFDNDEETDKEGE